MEHATTAGEPSHAADRRHLRDENVVLICRDEKRGSGAYTVMQLDETDDPNAPYRLSCNTFDDISGRLKPLVVTRCPAHLRSSPTHKIDVVVSTRSGIGQALACWEAVVEPLLTAVQALCDDSNDGNDGDGDGDVGKQRSYHVVITQNARSVRDYAKSLGSRHSSGSGSSTILLLSGDGGIVDLMTEMAPLDDSTTSSSNRRPSVALLPLGTGNALFHSLHKPQYAPGSGSGRPSPPLVLGLRTLLRGTPKPLPAFRASFSAGATLAVSSSCTLADDQDDGRRQQQKKKRRPLEPERLEGPLLGAIVASYGFHASMVWESDTPAYRKHGSRRFGMVAQGLLQENHAYEVVVSVRRRRQLSSSSSSSSSSSLGSSETVQDEQLHTSGGPQVTYVLATMVSNLEKDFTISPDSSPLDGKLRLVHFGHLGSDGGRKTMEIMAAAHRDGEHVDREDVGYEEIDQVRIEMLEDDARWRKVCIDGTIVEVEKGGWVSVEKEKKSLLDIII